MIDQKYNSTDDIKLQAEENGSHFFSESTLRFFNSRIYSTVYQGPGGIYFVTSERIDTDHPRVFTVRQFQPPGNIKTVGEFQQYKRAEAARKAAKELAEQIQE